MYGLLNITITLSTPYHIIDITILSCYRFGMANLKELRFKLFLSQSDLAKKAGMSAATINRLEKSYQKPALKTIRKLAEALEVQPGEIEF